MWKKILPLVFLAALVAWGIYDYSKDHSESGFKEDQERASSASDNQKEKEKDIGIMQGEQAPDFALQNLQGKSVKLSDFRGKKVMVNFWATWCPPCRAEMPELQTFYEGHKDSDFTILGVNLTGTEKRRSVVKPFVKEYGVTYPIILDLDNKAASTYEVTGYPTSYFINKQGVVQFKLVGAINKEMIQKVVGQME